MGSITDYVPVIIKGPVDDRDYGFNMAPEAKSLKKPYLASGELVVTLNVTANPGVNSPGCTNEGKPLVNDPAPVNVEMWSINANADGIPASQIVAWLSGGTMGADYLVKYDGVTSEGRTFERSMILRIDQL